MKQTRYMTKLLAMIPAAALTLLAVSSVHPAPYGAQWYDVSEYLLGTVYIKVFFLESSDASQNTENWTGEEKDNCRSALERAMAEIRGRFISEFEVEKGSGRLPPGVNLDFVFDYETVEVSVEPIKQDGSGVVFSRGDLKMWVNEVMAERGFDRKTPPGGPRPLLPYPPFQYNVAEYADHLRNENGTDWAVVIFFFDNSDDEDGMFANKRSAGPPMGVGGPGLHFSNNRGRPFINRQRSADDPHSYIGLIHEFLHLWYAVDEHTKNKHLRGDAVLGYLGGENKNYGMAEGRECSMYSANLYWPALCEYTKKHIGWTDSDGDHIPDILDVQPVLTVTSRTDGERVEFSGEALSPPLPNRNPYSEGGTIRPPHDLSVVLHLAPVPSKRLGIKKLFRKTDPFEPPFPWTKNDITINEIISVEYRVSEGGRTITDWTAAAADDGAFDDTLEKFHFGFGPPGPGRYEVEVRASNSVFIRSSVQKIVIDR